MPKAIIVADMRYKKVGEEKSLRDLLRYFQFRDGSVRRDAFLSTDPNVEFRYPAGLSDNILPTHRDTKWVDRGMGETYQQIASQALDLRLAVAPPPHRAMLPKGEQDYLWILQVSTESAWSSLTLLHLQPVHAN